MQLKRKTCDIDGEKSDIPNSVLITKRMPRAHLVNDFISLNKMFRNRHRRLSKDRKCTGIGDSACDFTLGKYS